MEKSFAWRVEQALRKLQAMPEFTVQSFLPTSLLLTDDEVAEGIDWADDEPLTGNEGDRAILAKVFLLYQDAMSEPPLAYKHKLYAADGKQSFNRAAVVFYLESFKDGYRLHGVLAKYTAGPSK